MKQSPDPREANLPKWAQRLLNAERSRTEQAERKLREHVETVERTRISYGDYENPLYIPAHFGLQTVRFDLAHEPRGALHDQIAVGMRPDYDGVLGLEIMGGHGIAIEPQASNVVRVYHAQ